MVVVRTFEARLKTAEMFSAGKTWVDRDSCARYTPEGERRYCYKSVWEDNVLKELYRPRKRSAPRFLVHISSAFRRGKVLKPHVALQKVTMAREYYANMLASDAQARN